MPRNLLIIDELNKKYSLEDNLAAQLSPSFQSNVLIF